MSSDTKENSVHIGCVSVDVDEKVKEIDSIREILSDSGLETLDSCCAAVLPTDNENSLIKSVTNEDVDESFSSGSHSKHQSNHVLDNVIENNTNNSSDTPKITEISSTDNTLLESSEKCGEIANGNLENFTKTFTSSSVSLDIEKPTEQSLITKSTFSRSAENISFHENIENFNLNFSDKELNTDKILSEFSSHKPKACAVQKIPEQPVNLDSKYTRIPKEILSQDIGSIVKNVHGIFSSVSGSLKNAYTHRTAYTQKPVKTVKNLPNGKLMNDIFEDDNTDTSKEVLKTDDSISESTVPNLNDQVSNIELTVSNMEDNSQGVQNDVLKLQVESLEKLLAEQRKENGIFRDRVKEQCDELLQKDLMFKEFEVKLDLMSKRVDQAEREKDAAVMRYASVECAAIEARRSAENAGKTEKMAHAEVELLNGKLKSAHGEKQRICQLYDDKCHELMNTEREMTKLREDLRELDGRLKWTQSKLRMEMDAYKDSSERADKLSQQVIELEAAKEAAIVNCADSLKAKQFESKLQESQAALILCRHERDELDKRLATVAQQLGDCTRERDAAVECLTRTTSEVESLKQSNLRLEEEAAELAALRAKASLADSLSLELERECERASKAEEALETERERAETSARREEDALQHAERVTKAHVGISATAERYEAEARALSVDNASLRERLSVVEIECNRLQTALSEETERRNKENRVLARKVAELTEEIGDADKKLEWEKGENGVLKKKHASAVKELNRELQRAMKRCEQLEAKLPATPEAPSTRTGSFSSLSSGESASHEERLTNGHTDTLPDIQIREPDKQALIERIVSLQRAAARRAERCEFLEEHSRQLTSELRNKARLLRHMLAELPAGAVGSTLRDANKKEIARLGGGAMAAVWGGDPGGMTAELSLEMNQRLQAVLEDTLLKNITLKENMDTLGAEISRLKEQLRTRNDTN